MTDPAEPLSIEQLADRAGVSVRTVRYYVSEGLLPGPSGRGRQAEYTADHLARLLLIRRLVEHRVPLGEQRRRLDRLTDGDVRTLLAETEREAQALQVAESSPREYVAGLLRRARSAHEPSVAHQLSAPASAPRFAVESREAHPIVPSPSEPAASEIDGESYRRVELAPGLELHISTDAAASERPLIDRIIALAQRRRYRGRR
jgi:DNA-binding transcriptional MerR regulator